MEDQHIGSLISVDCLDGSLYQGKLTTVDAKTKNITIANAFREGVPLGKCVTLSATQISSLKVLKAPPNQQATSSSSISNSNSNTNTISSSSNSKHSNIGQNKKSPKKNAIDKLFEQAQNTKKLPEKVDISATPLFQSFEPQVPHPTILSKLTAGSKIKGSGGGLSNGNNGRKNCDRKQGPSGIPLLDALNCYKGIRTKNSRQKQDLGSIDFDPESDFDFAENLKLFEKGDENDDEYFENVEKLKCSKNFAHYENIVEDEDRVISWTSVKSSRNTTWSADISPIKADRPKFTLNSISFEKSKNGQPIPAVSIQQKRDFLKEASNSMGELVYETITADRLFEWICDVQMRFGDEKGTIVLIASAKNSVKFIRRILTHLDKRRFDCHLFGKYPGEEFEHVNVVDNIKELPESPIICLLSSEINEDVETWLRFRSSTSTHFISIESIPQPLPPNRVHLLMYGCATSGLRHVQQKLATGRTCFEQLCGAAPSIVAVDSAIADLGTPTNWFDEMSKEFISAAFSTSFLINLSSN